MLNWIVAKGVHCELNKLERTTRHRKKVKKDDSRIEETFRNSSFLFGRLQLRLLLNSP